MTIKSKEELAHRGIAIDLTGPQGNAIWLTGYAGKLAKQLDLDVEAIRKDMMSSDYDHLLEVFEREFGSFVTLYR